MNGWAGRVDIRRLVQEVAAAGNAEDIDLSRCAHAQLTPHELEEFNELLADIIREKSR
jgi:hypothetical protein